VVFEVKDARVSDASDRVSNFVVAWLQWLLNIPDKSQIPSFLWDDAGLLVVGAVVNFMNR
jgi:hypothetical protein